MRSLNVPKWVRKSIAFNNDYANLDDSQKNEVINKLLKFHTEEPLVSIVIPAWNEEANILKTLHSLAQNEFDFNCELIVVNNNSTDNTQIIIDELKVKSFTETIPGIGPARQKGLVNAKGKYILCCDSDTIYPPTWIATMTETMISNEKKGVTAIFGSYSLLPSEGQNRLLYAVHEQLGSSVRMFKYRKRLFLAVFGFNFGFLRSEGIASKGFIKEKPRVGLNIPGTPEYVAKSEDGVMARSLMERGGKLLYVNKPKARVWTSDRRLMYEGSFVDALKVRVKKYLAVK
jgi:glycosyltransferase involved in cell wall biosynthesis